MSSVFNYNHLYYFYMMVISGGLSEAAHRLRTSQSSLSIQLKTLESSLNRKLFARKGRRLVLTPEGEQVYFYCRSAFTSFDSLNHYLQSSPDGQESKIQLGVCDEIHRPFATELIARAFESSPIPQTSPLKLISHSHEMLAKKLECREIDVLLSSRIVQTPGLQKLAEFPIPVALVGNSKTSRNQISATRFLRDSKIGLSTVSRDHLFRREVDIFMARRRIESRVMFESNVFAAVTQALRDGLAVGFCPLSYVKAELDARELSVIGSPRLWTHTLYLYGRSNEIKRAWIRKLTDSIKTLQPEHF